MSDKAFFDTNVLVYVVGQQDERTAKAEALVANGGTVSVQVLNEFASVSRRKLGMSWGRDRRRSRSNPSALPLAEAVDDRHP